MEQTINNITKQINTLSHQLRFIGKTQLMIVEKLSLEDSEFMANFVMSALSNKEILTGFTDYMFNEVKNVPDSIKTLLMELNEIKLQIDREEE